MLQTVYLISFIKINVYLCLKYHCSFEIHGQYISKVSNKCMLLVGFFHYGTCLSSFKLESGQHYSDHPRKRHKFEGKYQLKYFNNGVMVLLSNKKTSYSIFHPMISLEINQIVSKAFRNFPMISVEISVLCLGSNRIRTIP